VFTSVAVRSSTDFLLTNAGDTSCSPTGGPHGPCIYYSGNTSTTPAAWEHSWGAEQIIADSTSNDIYALDNNYVVWYLYKSGSNWVNNNPGFTQTIANSSGSCTGSGIGTLYADEIAARGGILYAIQDYTATTGAGKVYWYDTSSSSCWTLVTSSPQVLSIATDNYSSSAYSFWATDTDNKVHVVCTTSPCPAP
jgi:hypothetical protein